MNDSLAYIFARGGSKSVPRKNLRLLAGKSLLARAIETSLNSKYISRTIVSTDDEEIAEQAIKYGATVPFIRPKELASDTANEWMAWRHAITYTISSGMTDENTIFVSVPTTTPLKSSAHIDQCIDLFKQGKFDMVVTGCESNHHPAFNMVRKADDGSVRLISPNHKNVLGRQFVPYKAYNLTTACYVTSQLNVLSSKSIFDNSVGMVDIDQWAALDIDTEFDLKIAELILSRTSIGNTKHH